jgi:hypothetical protein
MGYFDTVNTHAIKGNRIYISTQFRYGRYALQDRIDECEEGDSLAGRPDSKLC